MTSQIRATNVFSEPPASTRGHIARPGMGSWLAFLFVGMSALAWTRNGDIIGWLLSHGLVEEAATRTLPGALRYVFAAGGILGLIAAWRIATWSVAGIFRWKPIQILTAYLATAMRPLVKSVWTPVAGTLLALRRAMAWPTARIWRGLSTVVRATIRSLGYVRVRVSTGSRLLWTSVSAIGRIVGQALGYMGMRVSTDSRLLWIGALGAVTAGAIGSTDLRLAIAFVAAMALVALVVAMALPKRREPAGEALPVTGRD